VKQGLAPFQARAIVRTEIQSCIVNYLPCLRIGEEKRWLFIVFGYDMIYNGSEMKRRYGRCLMETLHGFNLLIDKGIPEIEATARLYRHAATGAELLSIECDEENKVFGITFKTPSPNSTGVPHIMEHSVLCGSKRYRTKDPFAVLLKGSLQTFLNAFTFPDKTCYPVASQNYADLRNLIDVYMDAVFHPLLTPQIFEQEGWHYELDNIEDPLTIKGVVYNEMKGYYSSPDSILGDYSQFSLFPGNEYRFESGGDPAAIPHLTYEQFMNFHQTYYHPGNSFIYFYGNDDPEERLKLMNGYLKGYGPLERTFEIGLQPLLDKQERIERAYAGGSEDSHGRGGMMTMNWLLPETADAAMNIALRMLEYILIGMPASPLRKALIDSGLGEDIAGTGLETEIRQMFFSTGLRGINPDNTDRVEELIESTLASLVEKGIGTATIEAAVNTIEFRFRENNSGVRFPRGLGLMLRSLTTWLYGGDPMALLAFEEPLAAVKSAIREDGRYFEKLIDRYFISNRHRTTLLLRQDSGLARKEEEAEAARLAQIKSTMDHGRLKEVIRATESLRQMQEAPDDPVAVAAIPRMHLKDIDRNTKDIPTEIMESAGCRVLYHDIPTANIAYLDLCFDLHTLPERLLPYMPLFGRALTEMGTDTEDFVSLSQRINSKTGGITSRIFTSAVMNEKSGAVWLVLRSKAMLDNVRELISILSNIIGGLSLDNRERFRQMVMDEKARREALLVPAGHEVVNIRLAAAYDESAWAAEQMSGISGIFFLRRLLNAVDTSWEDVLADLTEIKDTLFRQRAIICNVTMSDQGWKGFKPILGDFLAGIASQDAERMEWKRPGFGNNEGLIIPSQVNYVGKAASLYELGYTLDGSIDVIRKYLRTAWLWDRVRLQGGAYGCFAFFDIPSGVLSLISYRDPNLMQTLQTYDETAAHLRNIMMSKDDLERTIIGAIGERDTYRLPDVRGYEALLYFLTGRDIQFRQRLREETMTATLDDLRSFGNVISAMKESGRITVLGSEDAIGDAIREHPGMLEPVKVL
jgi:Zn-dependent M16 (insulinase) family peptidase